MLARERTSKTRRRDTSEYVTTLTARHLACIIWVLNALLEAFRELFFTQQMRGTHAALRHEGTVDEDGRCLGADKLQRRAVATGAVAKRAAACCPRRDGHTVLIVGGITVRLGQAG